MNIKRYFWFFIVMFSVSTGSLSTHVYLYPETHNNPTDIRFKDQIKAHAVQARVALGQEGAVRGSYFTEWSKMTTIQKPLIFGAEEPVTFIFSVALATVRYENRLFEHKDILLSIVQALNTRQQDQGRPWTKDMGLYNQSEIFEVVGSALLKDRLSSDVINDIQRTIGFRLGLLKIMFINGSIIERLAAAKHPWAPIIPEGMNIHEDPIFQNILASYSLAPKGCPSVHKSGDINCFEPTFDRLAMHLFGEYGVDEWALFEKRLLIFLLGSPEMIAGHNPKAFELFVKLVNQKQIPLELYNYFVVDTRDYAMSESLRVLSSFAHAMSVPLVVIVGAAHQKHIAALLGQYGIEARSETIPASLCRSPEEVAIWEDKLKRIKCFAQTEELSSCDEAEAISAASS